MPDNSFGVNGASNAFIIEHKHVTCSVGRCLKRTPDPTISVVPPLADRSQGGAAVFVLAGAQRVHHLVRRLVRFGLRLF